ncbi:hypothetical protein ACOSP7_017354 [Xanthoceras sorbifolium]
MLLGSGVQRRFDGGFDFKLGERRTIERWLQRYQGGEATSRTSGREAPTSTEPAAVERQRL